LVAFHNPIPEKKSPRSSSGSPSGNSGLLGAWVQAEKMMQVVLILPSAGFVCWVIGTLLDRWLHVTWIATAGAIFGILAGLVAAVRLAILYTSGAKNDGSGGAS
jgi:ATP synthase protein I